jgi:hypothetical protein
MVGTEAPKGRRGLDCPSSAAAASFLKRARALLAPLVAMQRVAPTRPAKRGWPPPLRWPLHLRHNAFEAELQTALRCGGLKEFWFEMTNFLSTIERVALLAAEVNERARRFSGIPPVFRQLAQNDSR